MPGRMSAVVNLVGGGVRNLAGAIAADPIKGALIGGGLGLGGIAAYSGYRALNPGFSSATETEMRESVNRSMRGEAEPRSNQQQSYYRPTSQNEFRRQQADAVLDSQDILKERLRLSKELEKNQTEAALINRYQQALGYQPM